MTTRLSKKKVKQNRYTTLFIWFGFSICIFRWRFGHGRRGRDSRFRRGKRHLSAKSAVRFAPNVKATIIHACIRRRAKRRVHAKAVDFSNCVMPPFFFWPLNIRTACIIPLRAVCQMVFFCLFSWFLCYISGLVFVFRIKMKVFACFVVLAAVCAAAQAQFANGRILEPPVPSLCAQRVIHERRPDGKSLFLNLIFIDLTKRPN